MKWPPVQLPVPRKTRSRSVKNVADAKFAGKTIPANLAPTFFEGFPGYG